MSGKGPGRLAKESEIKGEKSLSAPHRERGRQKEDLSSALQANGPRGGAQVEVRVSPQHSGANALKILHSSTWYPILVERAKQFVRTTQAVG